MAFNERVMHRLKRLKQKQIHIQKKKKDNFTYQKKKQQGRSKRTIISYNLNTKELIVIASQRTTTTKKVLINENRKLTSDEQIVLEVYQQLHELALE